VGLVHEWALAEAVVKTVEELVTSNKYVRHIEVVLGELQAVDEGVFETALRELLEIHYGFKITREEAVFKCMVCGYEWSLKDWSIGEEFREAIHFVPEVVHSYYSCPKCGSRDFEIVRGRGVKVRVD
jgi:hydrogenase nickel incorporation protein HypA/HybF